MRWTWTLALALPAVALAAPDDPPAEGPKQVNVAVLRVDGIT